MEMSRIRIEGLLAAFPKLVGTGKQHTFVETENVRYLYQPMEVRSIPGSVGAQLQAQGTGPPLDRSSWGVDTWACTQTPLRRASTC